MSDLSDEIAAARRMAIEAARLPDELAAMAAWKAQAAYQDGFNAGYWNMPDLASEFRGNRDWQRGFAEGRKRRADDQEDGIF